MSNDHWLYCLPHWESLEVGRSVLVDCVGAGRDAGGAIVDMQAFMKELPQQIHVRGLLPLSEARKEEKRIRELIGLFLQRHRECAVQPISNWSGELYDRYVEASEGDEGPPLGTDGEPIAWNEFTLLTDHPEAQAKAMREWPIGAPPP